MLLDSNPIYIYIEKQKLNKTKNQKVLLFLNISCVIKK